MNEVRTLDDTLMTIKIMIIYELVDIFTMVALKAFKNFKISFYEALIF